ncbi:MAG: 1,2-phenylacetyl-CoA epoxidase subunit PaaD [Ignavibacteriota bacterium]
MLSKEEIYSLLSSIPDPEIPVITIDELGILRNVEIASGICEVTITPTYTGCPAMQMIEDEIKTILTKAGIAEINVKTTYSPAWTTDWISDDAKLKLKSYGISPPSPTGSTFEFIPCPNCDSLNTEILSNFGSTACKGMYRCNDCKETFDYFKPH